MDAITIIIADSTDFCRDALASFIRENPLEYHLLCTASHGPELIEKSKQLQPNLVITQPDLPGMCNLELCRQLQQHCANTRIIVRPATDIAYHARRLMVTNVKGVLPRDASNTEIRQCLYSVHGGGYHFDRRCSQLLGRKLREEKELNNFEKEVLDLLCRWKATEKIAAELFVSLSKVRRARERIYRQAGTSNPYDLLRWASMEGYISLHECWGV